MLFFMTDTCIGKKLYSIAERHPTVSVGKLPSVVPRMTDNPEEHRKMGKIIIICMMSLPNEVLVLMRDNNASGFT